MYLSMYKLRINSNKWLNNIYNCGNIIDFVYLNLTIPMENCLKNLVMEL